MSALPEGFNHWSQEVQLRYIDAQKEVRMMELTLQLETLKMKRLSLGKGDAVFIFYIMHEGSVEVSGTAFAINADYHRLPQLFHRRRRPPSELCNFFKGEQCRRHLDAYGWLHFA